MFEKWYESKNSTTAFSEMHSTDTSLLSYETATSPKPIISNSTLFEMINFSKSVMTYFCIFFLSFANQSFWIS